MTSRDKILGQATFAWPFHGAGLSLVSASDTAGLSNLSLVRRLSLHSMASSRIDFAFKALCMHDLVVITMQHNKSFVTLGAD